MEMRTEKYIKNYVFGWQDLCMLRNNGNSNNSYEGSKNCCCFI